MLGNKLNVIASRSLYFETLPTFLNNREKPTDNKNKENREI